jgi:hypothetical protein
VTCTYDDETVRRGAVHGGKRIFTKIDGPSMSRREIVKRAWEIAHFQCRDECREAAVREVCALVGKASRRSDLSNVSLTPEQLDDWSKVPD